MVPVRRDPGAPPQPSGRPHEPSGDRRPQMDDRPRGVRRGTEPGLQVASLASRRAPAPVPDRREWLFATVEDSDGYSNVRARPTTASDIVGTVREGETFSTWRQEGSWWQVELSDGTRGYIYRRLIRLTGSDGAGTQVPGDANGMIFADSSTRRLSDADLAGLDVGTLRIARNEIYARRGYRFEDDALRSYFSRFSWYSPRTDSVTLTAVEQDNVALIRRAEARLGR